MEPSCREDFCPIFLPSSNKEGEKKQELKVLRSCPTIQKSSLFRFFFLFLFLFGFIQRIPGPGEAHGGLPLWSGSLRSLGLGRPAYLRLQVSVFFSQGAWKDLRAVSGESGYQCYGVGRELIIVGVR